MIDERKHILPTIMPTGRAYCRLVITILIGLIAGTSSSDEADQEALYNCVDTYYIRYIAFAAEYENVGLLPYRLDRSDPISLAFARHIAPALRCPVDNPRTWHPVTELFPAVAVIDNTTLTDVYVFANGTCMGTTPPSCVDDFAVTTWLIDHFLAVMPRSYLGYELPTVKGKDFVKVLRDQMMSAECLDPRGYRTTPLGKIESCYAFYQMNAGSTARFSAGRLTINNVAQSTLVLDRSSALRVFYESGHFCKMSRDVTIEKNGRKCESFVTGSNYALLCCCYEQASECHLPNVMSYFYKPKNDVGKNPTTYSCATGRTMLPSLFDNEDDKNVTWLETLHIGDLEHSGNNLTVAHNTFKSLENKHVANGNSCVATFSYNYSQNAEGRNHLYNIVVDFKPQASHCHHSALYDGCTPTREWSDRNAEDCPDEEHFHINDYKMECCCCDAHLCNVNFLFDTSEFFRQRFRPADVAVRPQQRMVSCYYATDSISAFQSVEDSEETYMCSVFYDPFEGKTLAMYDGFNARIHFDSSRSWAKEEMALILVSFKNCGRYPRVIPVFVANCGPPHGEPTKYEQCDVRLKENITAIYNRSTSLFNTCPIVSRLIVSGNDEVNGLFERLEEMVDNETPENTLFCYMTVDSSYNESSRQMTHEISAGTIERGTRELDDCANLVENNRNQPRGHRFCVVSQDDEDPRRSRTMCCCFIGIGFESCLINDIISEVVISNNLLVVEKMDSSKAEHESGAMSCETSYNVVKVSNVSGNCMQRQGCYRIYNFGKTAMEFQLWAGCTSNIPQESIKDSIMSFAAYCRSRDPARQDVHNRPAEYEYDVFSREDYEYDELTIEEDGKHVPSVCYVINLESLLYSPDKKNDDNDRYAEDDKSLKPSSNLTQLCCCYYGSCRDTLPNNWGYRITDEI